MRNIRWFLASVEEEEKEEEEGIGWYTRIYREEKYISIKSLIKFYASFIRIQRVLFIV